MGMERVQIEVLQASAVKLVKDVLESKGILNKRVKIQKRDEVYTVPTTLEEIDVSEYFDDEVCAVIRLSHYSDVETDQESVFVSMVRKYAQGKIDTESLQEFIPKRWQVYSPMLLLPANTFDSSVFASKFLDKIDRAAFMQDVCAQFNVTHIAVNRPISEQDNAKRIPYDLVPIHGDFGPEITARSLVAPTSEDFESAFWCRHVQNNVCQNWAPRYTMFSRGNIVEKQRVLTFETVRGTDVVDLYSGIGYFTLYYLVNSPRRCFCWELNPWSNQGLIRSLEQMHITYKLITSDEIVVFDDDETKVYIFQEDNQRCVERLQGIIDDLYISHINAGLLPTSSLVWPRMVQLAARSKIATVLHIHENCHVDRLGTIMEEVGEALRDEDALQGQNIVVKEVKLNKVKTYAPDVWHVVCDFELDIE